jgi:phage tail sheath protein FI
LGDGVAFLDAPPNMTPQEIRKWRMETAGYDSSYAALYYPWIQVDDPVHNRAIYIPPCGHMAGVWARNDNTRGVHKAPANEVVQGVIGLAYDTTKGEQDTLNPDGINCIRAFPGRGIRVWGARTLASDPAWRYINVRRLFNFVEKSIERGTHWVVFEPNDHKLWARVRRDVSAFLRTVWRDGALFGLSPEEAFYVKCDEELNPADSRDQGKLIIEIGLCPVKPAEFVIFRISQFAGPNAEA